MKITVHSSRSVKPAYAYADAPAAASDDVVPLTVFDEVMHDVYVPWVFAFHPPAPASSVLEAALAEVLAEYREWAGRLRLRPGGTGRREILLNDAGVRLVEATADVPLGAVMPLEMGPEAQKLHPGPGCGEELLLLVQVTRFPCGSFAVGFNTRHAVADGHATCNFMLAWGRAARGGAAAASFDPVPVHDRASFFVPRSPPRVEFEHRGAEYKPRARGEKATHDVVDGDGDVVVRKVRYSRDFISRLKAQVASSPATASRPYSSLQCVAAHLWQCVTLARGLHRQEATATTMYVTVNGRRRIRPPLPEGYFGNAVLWVRPATTVRELLDRPLQDTVELISQAVAGIGDAYFRSFIDFASSGAVEEEGLVRTAVSSELVKGTNVELDSLLGFPFCDLDFGSGKPLLFMPNYHGRHPAEGAVYLVPTCSGDGSIDAYVPLFRRAVDTFDSCCFSLLPVTVFDRLMSDATRK